MAERIAERELANGGGEERQAAERKAAPLTLEALAPQWLDFAENVKAMTPKTLSSYRYDVAALTAAPEIHQVPPGARHRAWRSEEVPAQQRYDTRALCPSQ
jgi:hypothetical protein